MATVVTAESDAEMRFATRAAGGRGQTKRGLSLLAKAAKV
jgi:hypothetical protein